MPEQDLWPLVVVQTSAQSCGQSRGLDCRQLYEQLSASIRTGHGLLTSPLDVCSRVLRECTLQACNSIAGWAQVCMYTSHGPTRTTALGRSMCPKCICSEHCFEWPARRYWHVGGTALSGPRFCPLMPLNRKGPKAQRFFARLRSCGAGSFDSTSNGPA